MTFFLLDLILLKATKVILNSGKKKIKILGLDSPQVKLAELFSLKVFNLYISSSLTLFDSDASCSALSQSLL